MASSVRWSVVPFSQLSGADVYALLALRQRVFVVEQTCAFLDADGVDADCLHVLAWSGDTLVACARLVPAGRVHPDVAIGRVVTAPEVRRTGLGRELMVRSIAAVEATWGRVPIHLGAQAYLQAFYGGLGFVVDGPGYDEDGIWHVPMSRPVPG